MGPRHARAAARASLRSRLAAVIVLFGMVSMVVAWQYLAPREAAPDLPPTPQSPGPVRLGILLGGDVLLDLEPGKILAAEGPEALLPGWLALRRLPDVDLAVANLECPLSGRGAPWEGKKFTFRADPDAGARCLVTAGFDVLGLANNHALDFGYEALADTIEALEESGISYAGAGLEAAAYAPALVEREGIRIAVLAFCNSSDLPGSSWLAGKTRPGVAVFQPLDRVLSAVTAARGQADLVVVSCHWGLEYFPVSQAQQQTARALIDAGADLVFGHHPHIPQAVEVYRGKPVIYSLGNLVFHPFQPKARGMCAALVRWERDPDGALVPLDVEIYPLCNDGGRTVTMPAEMSGDFLLGLAEQSAALGTDLLVLDGMLVLSLGGRGTP